jgi:ribose transport system substrate-binding protein
VPEHHHFSYADGQGNTQKAISDIQGMVAKGVNALVVFPDAGQAVLPTLRSAYQAGVKVVPYRVFPAAPTALTTTCGSAPTSPPTARTGRTGS